MSESSLLILGRLENSMIQDFNLSYIYSFMDFIYKNLYYVLNVKMKDKDYIRKISYR